jgi:anti-sigma factor RsiW
MSYTPSFRDVEKLSAYLDGQLKSSEKARLESRLQSDPELASILKELRQTRGLLRQLPQRRAPRNFTLTPKMVGQKPPLPRTYPVFRFATALATLLLFFTFAANSVAPSLATAPYPYGRGGGGGGEPEVMMESAPAEGEQPTEEPAMEEPAAPELPAPLATQVEPSAEDSANAEPTVEATEKSGVQEAPQGDLFAQQMPDQVQERTPVRPISVPVQIVLAVIAAVSGLVAFLLRYSAVRKWRAKAR